MPDGPRVLLTNDDGYAAAGLQALRSALRGDGCAVTVIAPAANRSGVGRAVTCRGPVTVERIGGDDENPVYSCTGTPVDCVRIGVFAREFAAPDVVASGINHGVNLGDDATYSGTLGAAMEAALLGHAAVAFSPQDEARDVHLLSGSRHEFHLAWLAARIAREAATLPHGERLAFNVNLPNQLREPSVAVTRLGALSYDGRWMRPVEQGPSGWTFHPYMRADDPHPQLELAADTDMGSVAAGRVSMTPISLEWSGADARVRARAWAVALAEAAERGLRDGREKDDRKVVGT